MSRCISYVDLITRINIILVEAYGEGMTWLFVEQNVLNCVDKFNRPIKHTCAIFECMSLSALVKCASILVSITLQQPTVKSVYCSLAFLLVRLGSDWVSRVPTASARGFLPLNSYGGALPTLYVVSLFYLFPAGHQTLQHHSNHIYPARRC